MFKYVIGWISNLLIKNVSSLAQIDNISIINRKAKIWGFTKIINSRIDAYSYVGRNTEIVYSDIGKFCSIAGNCSIGLGIHSTLLLSTSSIFVSEKNGTGITWTKKNILNEYKRIKIGNDVWIGTKVIILGGVTIGDGAIIGAGSVVTKDVPPYAIMAGVPARIVRYRFDEQSIEKLLELRWWNASEKQLRENINFFQHNQVDLEEFKKSL